MLWHNIAHTWREYSLSIQPWQRLALFTRQPKHRIVAIAPKSPNLVQEIHKAFDKQFKRMERFAFCPNIRTWSEDTMESDNLKTASLYINNQLLSRGLLRNGQTIEFARPEKGDGGVEGTMGRVMSVVNDLILRRDVWFPFWTRPIA